MSDLIKVSDLTKKYSRKTVLNGINFTFKEGEIYGLVGNNGVGKTTLLRIIADMARPTNGKVEVIKKDLRMGTLIESPALFRDMTGYENLRLKTLACGYKYTKQQLVERLKEVGLNKDGKLVLKYSTGMKQRLGIAMALLDEPDLLILDEPINGLDPRGIADVRNLLKRIHAESTSTMIISSHILDELLRVATYFLFIKDGHIVYDISVEDLLKEIGDGDINDYYLSIMARE